MAETIKTPKLTAGSLLVALVVFFAATGIGHLFRQIGHGAALRSAVRKNDLPAARRILEQCPQAVDSRDRDFNATPLHWAAVDGHVAMARLLIEYGADVNARDRHGAVPLHKAAVFGHEDVVNLLAAAGADLDATALKYQRIHMTALHLAAEAGLADTVAALIDAGADLNVTNADGRFASPLHLAAGRGHYEVVRLLLDRGADPEALDGANANTPREWARQMAVDRRNKGLTDEVFEDIQRLLRLAEGRRYRGMPVDF